MNTNLVKDVEFKTGKFVFMLFIFQTIAAIATNGLVSFLTKVINIQNSISLEIAATILSFIIGCIHFAYWAEKKHPGVLSIERIKSVSRRYIAIGYMIFAFGFAGITYLTEGSLNLIEYGYILLAMLLASALDYLCTKYCITRSCKMMRAKNKILLAS